MKKEIAEAEKVKHANLLKKLLVHKIYNTKKMQVVEMGVLETSPKSKDYYVYCKLNGDLGKVTETLEYVLSHYTNDVHRY